MSISLCRLATRVSLHHVCFQHRHKIVVLAATRLGFRCGRSFCWSPGLSQQVRCRVAASDCPHTFHEPRCLDHNAAGDPSRFVNLVRTVSSRHHVRDCIVHIFQYLIDNRLISVSDSAKSNRIGNACKECDSSKAAKHHSQDLPLLPSFPHTVPLLDVETDWSGSDDAVVSAH